MPEPQKRPAGAVDMTASDLVALAQNPAAFDKLIKEIVAARESAHDRERRAVTAEASLEAEKTALAAARPAGFRERTQPHRTGQGGRIHERCYRKASSEQSGNSEGPGGARPNSLQRSATNSGLHSTSSLV